MLRFKEDEATPLNVKKITPHSIKPLDIQLIAKKSMEKDSSSWAWAGSLFFSNHEDERVKWVACQMMLYSLEIKTPGQVWSDLINFYAKLPDHDSKLAGLIRKTVEDAYQCLVPTWRVTEILRNRYGSVPVKVNFTVAEVVEKMKRILNPKNLPPSTPNRRLASC